MEKDNERSDRRSFDVSISHWNWRQIPQSSNSPPPRHLHSLVHYNNYLYLFGGFGNGEKYLDDFWQYSLVKRRWKKIKSKTHPAPRHSHQAVVWKNKMILFGGISEGKTMNDLWSFDFTSESWTQERTLHRAWGHSMAVVADKIIIFGGADENFIVTNRLAILDAETLSDVNIDIDHLPTSRQYASIVAHNDTIYLFGGFYNKSLNDFYKLSINNNNQITTETLAVSSIVPSLRAASLSVLPYHSQLILFGGRTNEKLGNATFSFALGSSKWSACRSVRPSARYYHQTCTVNGTIFMFGGLGMSEGKEKATNLNDLWMYTDATVENNRKEQKVAIDYSSIPVEMWSLILSFIDSGLDISSTSVVSKQFYNIVMASDSLKHQLQSYISIQNMCLPEIIDNTIKLVVGGYGGSGKSATTIQLINNHFVDEYDPTIEDSYRKQVTVDNQTYLLDILDTAGPEEYPSLLETWYRTSHGIYMVYSITSRQSFKELDFYINCAKRAKDNQKFLLLIVGNKSDLESQRQVSQDEGKEYAKKHDAMWIETSAKTPTNITEAFDLGEANLNSIQQIPNISNLTSLKIRCPYFHFEGTAYIISQASQLKSLDITWIYFKHGLNLRPVHITALPNLENFRSDSYPIEGIENIVGLTKLQFIDRGYDAYSSCYCCKQKQAQSAHYSSKERKRSLFSDVM